MGVTDNKNTADLNEASAIQYDSAVYTPFRYCFSGIYVYWLGQLGLRIISVKS